MSKTFCSEFNIVFSSVINSNIFFSSSTNFSVSKEVNFCNFKSRIALHWASERLNEFDKNCLANSTVFDALIPFTTASILFNAICKPSKICARCSALFKSNLVLLIITSFL